MKVFYFAVYGENYEELQKAADLELKKLGGNWIISDFRVTRRKAYTWHYCAEVTADLVETFGG